MVEINLSREARADLVNIGDYGEAEFGGEAADAYQEDIDRALERLEAFPHSGAPRPEFGEEIRCLNCNRHRILYRVRGDIVQILRILHHSRDVPRHLPA